MIAVPIRSSRLQDVLGRLVVVGAAVHVDRIGAHRPQPTIAAAVAVALATSPLTP